MIICDRCKDVERKEDPKLHWVKLHSEGSNIPSVSHSFHLCKECTKLMEGEVTELVREFLDRPRSV